MDACRSCGKPAQVYVADVPLCIECDKRHDTKRKKPLSKGFRQKLIQKSQPNRSPVPGDDLPGSREGDKNRERHNFPVTRVTRSLVY
jgi:hypothetical protein